MKKIALASLVLLALIGLSGVLTAAWAQEVTAAIVGTVTDPSGAPIKGATVTVTDTERGTEWPATTNDAGAYNLPRLPIGTYSVKVGAAGFQTAVQQAFTLALNQTARVDIQMKVGKITETVEVTGAAPILKTESTSVDTVIDANTNDRLPLATRNYVQLTLLAPGSVTPNPDSFNNGDNTANGGRPYINGNREQANNFVLDGVDNNQVSDNLVGFTPAPDAIEEFNLITQNAPAEFGNYQGGIVNATIKSGTNAFHGDLWEYFRNDKLNANKWENGFAGPGQALPKDKLRWNMFGGTIGGPIVKNKLFFFFDWQSQRFDHPSSTQKVGVFTAAERGGNFGDICNNGFAAGICNDRIVSSSAPDGTTCAPGVAVSSNCLVANQLYDPFVLGNPAFANNIITEPIDPVAQALFSSSLYPSATGSGLQNNATYTTVSTLNNNQYDIKIDFNASSKDHLFGRYSHANQHNPSNNSFALLGGGFSDAPIENVAVDWSHTFSPTLLNDARVGINHVRLHNGPTFSGAAATAGTDFGIAGANDNRPGLLFLDFDTNSGPLTNVGNSWTEQKFQDAVIQASDAVVLTHNRHVFHTGFEFWRDRINTFYTGNNGALGQIQFNGQFTNCNPAAGTVAANSPNCPVDPSTNKPVTMGGYGGADFYLGVPDEYQRGIPGGEWGQRASIFGVYLQDDWRATDRLTVNLGLRYEAHTPWVEENNRQANFDLLTGEVIAPNCSIVDLGTAPTTCRKGSAGLYNATYGGKDFQPRIGLAWTPGALGGKSVLRSAFSISSYLEGTGTNLRLPINPPFTPAETRVANSGVNLPPTRTEDGIVPVGASTDPFASALVRVWDPHVQPAITYQWNFTWQQLLSNSLTLQAGYVGQHGIHEMVPTPYLQRRLDGEAGCVAVAPETTCPSIYFSGNPDFQKEISQISGTASTGSSNYHALQVVLQKRYTSGLQYQVAYTYSRCRTDNSGYYGNWGAQAAPANPYYQNLYDPKADWANCFFDSKNVLSAYAVYDIPFGHGKRWGGSSSAVANAVAGGWSISPIVSVHSGFPVALYDFNFANGDSADTGSRGLRPDCGSGAGKTFGRQKYFDPSSGAFAGYRWFDPTPYTDPANVFGTCPAQGPVVGPGYVDADLSLQKNFQLTERAKLQFRGDFLNAFNHVNLYSPNSSCCGGTMGVVSTSSSPRVIQFALKLYY